MRNKVHIVGSERTFLSVILSALSTVSDCKGSGSVRLSLMFMNTVLGVGRFCSSGSRKDCQPQQVTHTLTASQPVNKVMMSLTVVDVVTLLVLFTAF